jgi:hypothetical protein
LTEFSESTGVLDYRGHYRPLPFGCRVSSIPCRQPIFNTGDHAGKGLKAGLVSRVPRLHFPEKLPDGNRLLKLHLKWHLIHMVADEFPDSLAD